MLCNLCFEDKELIKSHVIPKFMFKEIFDNKSRMSTAKYNMLSDKYKEWRVQDSCKDSELLCSDCDGLIGKYETYYANEGYPRLMEHVFKKSYPIPSVSILRDIDYVNLKLCLLSILWRCEVSRLSPFKYVFLGEGHREKLRKMLLNGNPGEVDEYGIVIAELLNSNRDLEKIVDTMPKKMKPYGHNAYRVLICGILYIFYISNHEIPDLALETFPSPDNSVAILHADMPEFLIEEYNFFVRKRYS